MQPSRRTPSSPCSTRAVPERLICGVDEAGRGPIAGPVFAAAVVLARARPIAGLKDSKLLTPGRRETLAAAIRARATAWAVAHATVEEIDQLNILRATLLAMRRAVERLRVAPAEAWIDGDHCPVLACPARGAKRAARGAAPCRSLSRG